MFTPTNWQTVWDENYGTSPHLPGFGNTLPSTIPSLTQAEEDQILQDCINKIKALGYTNDQLNTDANLRQKVTDCYTTARNLALKAKQNGNNNLPIINANNGNGKIPCPPFEIPNPLTGTGNPLPAIQCYLTNFFTFGLVNVIFAYVGVMALVYLVTSASSSGVGRVIKKVNSDTGGLISGVINSKTGGNIRKRITKSKKPNNSDESA